MTVKELKQILEQYSDDAAVLHYSQGQWLRIIDVQASRAHRGPAVHVVIGSPASTLEAPLLKEDG